VRDGDPAWLDIAGRHRRPGARASRRQGRRRAALVVHTDINEAMLRQGRDRPARRGAWCCRRRICGCRERAVREPATLRLVSVGVRLRNMTHKDPRAGTEMSPRAAHGGRLLVLEFSKVAPPFAKAYDWYSFQVLPRLGRWVAGDADSYRYLAESIRMHPDQAELKAMMKRAGFGHVDIHNLSAGVVALHAGIKC
jgi:demethylmenaquinone methyltransferase/2-methoxy-6-polyprenyl-1,4-benzoquinol methylase